MSILLDKDALIIQLINNGLSNSDANIAANVFDLGVQFKINELNELKINIGEQVNINLISPRTDDILTTDCFEADILGIDPMQIRSITIPTLDYGNRDILSLGVELYPFKIKKFTLE